MRNRAQYERNRRIVLEHAVACTWCGCAISTTLPVGHPQKATADHVTPRAMGGTHDLDNLVPACFMCNCRRQNRSPNVLLPPRQRSQDW